MRDAGFWKRYAAWSLDAAIVAVPTALMTASSMRDDLRALRTASDEMLQGIASRMADAIAGGEDPLTLATRLATEPALKTAAEAVAANATALLATPLCWFAFFAAAYWIGFECSRLRATPGKRALRIHVGDLAGQRLQLPRVALRHFAGVLSWITLNVGHALAAWTPQKRALHDFVAGTRVIDDEDGLPGLPTWAIAWLLLQAAATLAMCVWLYTAMSGAMSAAINGIMLN